MKFINFLSDNREYELAEKYWADIYECINDKLPEEQKWQFWFETVRADGLKLKNGNPILARWHPKSKKAIRVIQEEAESVEDSYISAWMDTFDENINELVISCTLTEETELKAIKLISHYMTGSTPSEMRELIDDLI